MEIIVHLSKIFKIDNYFIDRDHWRLFIIYNGHSRRISGLPMRCQVFYCNSSSMWTATNYIVELKRYANIGFDLLHFNIKFINKLFITCISFLISLGGQCTNIRIKKDLQESSLLDNMVSLKVNFTF